MVALKEDHFKHKVVLKCNPEKLGDTQISKPQRKIHFTSKYMHLKKSLKFHFLCSPTWIFAGQGGQNSDLQSLLRGQPDVLNRFTAQATMHINVWAVGSSKVSYVHPTDFWIKKNSGTTG